MIKNTETKAHITEERNEGIFKHVREALDQTKVNLKDVKKALEETSPNKNEEIINRTNKLDERDTKIEELIDTLKRLQAEFENYKKRNDKERIEFATYAHADLIAKLLPIMDTFEIAFKSSADKEKFIEGMKMIYAQLASALESDGLRPIKAVGEKFDPYRHEVLMKEKSEKEDDTILEEFQKGYMFRDKVLRFSKVKISGK